jgi:hypothetical protein
LRSDGIADELRDRHWPASPDLIEGLRTLRALAADRLSVTEMPDARSTS